MRPDFLPPSGKLAGHLDGSQPYISSYMKPSAPASRRLDMLSPFCAPDAPAFATPGPVRRSTVHSALSRPGNEETPPLPPRRRSAGSADADGYHSRHYCHGAAGSRVGSATLGGDARIKPDPEGWRKDCMPSPQQAAVRSAGHLQRNASGGAGGGMPPRPDRAAARVARRAPVMSPFAAGGDYPAPALAAGQRPDDDIQREMSKEDFDELAAELAIGPRSASAPVLAPAMSREPLPVAHSIAAVEAQQLERYLREEIDLEREPAAGPCRDPQQYRRRTPGLAPPVWAA